MSFHQRDRRISNLFGGEDVSSTLVQDTVDSTACRLRALDLTEVHRLHQTRSGGQYARVEASASSGDDLSTATMDSIGVQGYVVDVEATASHILITENALLSGPIEGSHDGIFDF